MKFELWICTFWLIHHFRGIILLHNIREIEWVLKFIYEFYTYYVSFWIKCKLLNLTFLLFEIKKNKCYLSHKSSFRCVFKYILDYTIFIFIIAESNWLDVSLLWKKKCQKDGSITFDSTLQVYLYITSYLCPSLLFQRKSILPFHDYLIFLFLFAYKWLVSRPSMLSIALLFPHQFVI